MLFSTYQLGDRTLKNRVVMAPMTRSRALGNTPNEMMAEYYGNRADAGLLITEGTSPSPNGLGYSRIPGLFTKEQVSGWKKVTSRVKQNGGVIFLQMMHTGRVSHPLNLPEGAKVLAPSAIGISGEMWTDQKGKLPFPVPKEMTGEEIEQTKKEFILSSELAMDAGFDGIELHAANGYLLEQFLNPNSNQRNDRFGGSAEGRMRFLLEIVEGAAARIGGKNIGVRVSPYGVFNDMQSFSGIDQFYGQLSQHLRERKIAYIHVVDHSAMGAPPVPESVKVAIREGFGGTYILSGGYENAERADADLKRGLGDLVAFGRPYLANPDLVQKLKTKAPLLPPDFEHFYTPGREGYLP